MQGHVCAGVCVWPCACVCMGMCVCVLVSVCVMCVHVCVCGAGVGNCVYLTSTLCPCDPPPLLPPTCPPSCLCSPQVRELAYLPLADDIPVAFNSCRKGPRGVGFFCLGLLTGCRLHLPGSPGVGARPIWPWVSWSGCPPHMAAVSGCSCRVGLKNLFYLLPCVHSTGVKSSRPHLP